MAEKLANHRVAEAWAGSYEALFAKNIAGVNERLAEACRAQRGIFVPFGGVNPAWPDWEEDLRRCHEQFRMPGSRLYPGYQGYSLDHPDTLRLLRAAGERGLIVQVALGMEDPRVHHPFLALNDVNAPALLPALRDPFRLVKDRIRN